MEQFAKLSLGGATIGAPMREEIVETWENGCKVCAHHFEHLEARWKKISTTAFYPMYCRCAFVQKYFANALQGGTIKLSTCSGSCWEVLLLLLTYLLVYSILAVFSSGYGVRCVCGVSVITVIKSASIMNNPGVLTGYGPSHGSGRYARLMFDGDERKYEQW